MNKKIKTELGLDKFNIGFDDDRYFYDEKKIEQLYDAIIYEITVYKIVNQGYVLVIPMMVEYKGDKYDIFMVLSSQDQVYYGSQTEGAVESLRESMGGHFDHFDQVCDQILDDWIPYDFFDVRAIFN